ncbi:hypothetical protein HY768_08970 [candidate division TA06 bacterium]|uniref:DUF4412 domain-containing protein n=1 Tax=candidate division TA06 bacterium TaxID=2250710 RepID=A0A933IA04_UNCT6|nr:hypothetical protein [candidate division TA06 bacterium]
MVRLLSVVLSTMLIGAMFYNPVAAQTPVKKYDIKSGVVTCESIMKVSGMQIKEKIVVSFDDFGIKECKETFSGNTLRETYLSDGKDLYLVKPDDKTAYKRGTASRGTELRVEWSEFGTEKDRRSGKYKKLPAMKVAGKNCEVFEYNDGKGTITRYGGWKKILLYMNLKTKGMETTQRALKVEENAKVPAGKFKVPAGFTVQ